MLGLELDGIRLEKMDRLMHLANIPHHDQGDLKVGDVM